MTPKEQEKWKNRMIAATTPEEKLDIAGEFAGTTLQEVSDTMNKNTPKQIREDLKQIGRAARTIAFYSEGIQEGYRLKEEWLQQIIAQMTIDGAKSVGGAAEQKRALVNIIGLYKKLNWNTENIINPKPAEVTTVHKVKYMNGKEERLINIELIPTAKHPVGAIYESRSGKKWRLNWHKENDTFEMESEEKIKGSYKYINLTEQQLDSMKRLK